MKTMTLPGLLMIGSLLPLSYAQAGIEGFATQKNGTTGGAGGKVVRVSSGTGIHQALCNRASSNTPIIIHVEGVIKHSNTSKVKGDSCNTAEDKIELKEVSNVSIIGVGSGALFDELGIHLRSASNIILQNLHVRNVKKSGSPTSNGGDAIGMESNVSNVWADHLTLEASGGEGDGYDALFDLKANTKYITLSYSILRDSGRGGLVGSSDSDTNNGPVTFHHNWYENIDSRTPLLRSATAHAYNNYYNGINKSGMNPRVGGKMKAENNYFVNTKDPLGTFYTNEMGSWDVSGNMFTSTTWTADKDKNHPAGPSVRSTTSINIPYIYRMDDTSCVPNIVKTTAGANKGILESDGSCEVSSNSNPNTNDGTESNTESNSDTDTDTESNSNTESTADSNSDTTSDSNTETSSETTTDTNTESDNNSSMSFWSWFRSWMSQF